MKKIIVKTLGELIDLSTPNDPDPASGRLRDSSVYRGVSVNAARLLTSLGQLGGTEPPHTKAHLEEYLLRNFIRYGRQFLPQDRENIWEIMVIAEHHGLPTRLLDWTRSPLVAAHFATLSRQPGVDCVIWRLDWKKVHQHYGLRPVVFLVEDLDRLVKEHGMQSAWELMNANVPRDREFVCLLEPPAVTERLSVQAGAFTFSSVKTKPLDQTLEEAGLTDALTRYIIPAQNADYIRDQLDLCTIDERRLFPGLDGVAAELRRYYSVSGANPPAGSPEA